MPEVLIEVEGEVTGGEVVLVGGGVVLVGGGVVLVGGGVVLVGGGLVVVGDVVLGLLGSELGSGGTEPGNDGSDPDTELGNPVPLPQPAASAPTRIATATGRQPRALLRSSTTPHRMSAPRAARHPDEVKSTRPWCDVAGLAAREDPDLTQPSVPSLEW